jgi:hypothetical protein
MANKVDRFFKPTAHKLNWHKDDSERTRRKNALNSRHGSLIKTGHALLYLANGSSDLETKHKAKADATYFFAKHKRKMELQGKPAKKLRRRV